ncbi:MAG: hypothetical protein VX899_01445 [Myxococcota bacterium]|nr:hypothetical protein [Myxococcota bacterium]
MKKLSALMGVLALSLVMFFLWMTRSWPFDALPDAPVTAWEDASVEADALTVTGTAQYELRVSITRGAALGREEQTLYLFPLMKPGDINAKEIRIMVASPVEPDRFTTYEDLTVSGWALPPAAAMTYQLEDSFMERGYSFTDDYFVLEVFPPQEGQQTPPE